MGWGEHRAYPLFCAVVSVALASQSPFPLEGFTNWC